MALEFSIDVGTVMKPFLKHFHTEGPLIHELYDKMTDLVTVLLRRFIKSEVIHLHTICELQALDLQDDSDHLSHDKIEIGTLARRQLDSFVSGSGERKAYIDKMKACYAAITSHLLKTLPFDLKILKDLRCLQPLRRERPAMVREIRRIGETSPDVVVNDTEYIHICLIFRFYCLLLVIYHVH